MTLEQAGVTETDISDAAALGIGEGGEGDSLETPEGQVQTGTPSPETVDSLITDEEFNQLSSNPLELRKLIKERHDQALAKHNDVIEFKKAYDADPVATVTNLARRLGVLKDQQPSQPQQPQQPTIEQVTYARLSKVLGPQLAAEMTPVILEVAHTMADQSVAPIRQSMQQSSQQAAQSEATRIVSSYFDKNPDAIPHQETMFRLMNKYVPGPDMSDEEWLDLLYEKAASINAPKQVNDGRKVAAGLIKSTVQNIRGASPAQLVTKIPSVDGKKGGKSAELKRLAFEAATRGERWDG